MTRIPLRTLRYPAVDCADPFASFQMASALSEYPLHIAAVPHPAECGAGALARPPRRTVEGGCATHRAGRPCHRSPCIMEVEIDIFAPSRRPPALTPWLNWGSSSAGRAVRSQRTGRRFDPALLHKNSDQRPGPARAFPHSMMWRRRPRLRLWAESPCPPSPCTTKQDDISPVVQ